MKLAYGAAPIWAVFAAIKAFDGNCLACSTVLTFNIVKNCWVAISGP